MVETKITSPSDAVVADVVASEMMCYFSIKHPKLHVSITVAMGRRAFVACWERYAPYDIVITYDELVAVTSGIDKSTSATERDKRFREAFIAFANRQKMPLAFAFGSDTLEG